MPRLRLLLLLISLLTLAACGRSEPDPAPAALSGQLPALSSLKGDGLTRSTSATQFELIDSAPVAVSAVGVDTSGSQLALSPPTDSLAWAVYALQGFPTDGSIVPVSVTIDRSLPCWLAFSDFGAGRWEFVLTDDNGTFTPTATELLSPGGTFYVAVLGFPNFTPPINVTGASSVSSLVVNVSADIALPEPVLTTISATGQLAAGIPSWFSAEGSEPGTGAVITSITYDWNDGSPTEQVAGALDELSHTWPSAGNQTVTLTLENDKGVVVSKDFTVTLIEPFRELLVVYNSDFPESADLMNYYTSSKHGQLIDPTYVLGAPMGTAEEITRDTYRNLVRDPIKTFLDASSFKTTIKYIVTLKGVPFKITDTGGGNPNEPKYSAVDSELCTLYSDDTYPLEGRLYSGTKYPTLVADYFTNTGFFEGSDGANRSFTPFTFEVVDVNNVKYSLDYLVSRIAAYTYDEAKLMIDRSIGADTSGTGTVLIDSISSRYALDTMTDPVWPDSNDGAHRCLWEVLDDAGFSNYKDLDNSTIQLADLPDQSLGENVIAYAGWGTNHGGEGYASGKLYILQDLGFTYRPGAAWIVYESFAGSQFTWDGTPGNHVFQGQIADFIRMGGTVAIGNCYEPWSDACGDERRIFERYLIKGDRWIEAAYKGMRYLSWTTIVLGDPLCRVK